MMLYVNVPFCRSKCAFCDYVQQIPKEDLLLTAEDELRQEYIEALCQEIRARGEDFAGSPWSPKVLYWGGGTASILETHEIESVMSALQDAFPLDTLEEATIECSPDTISQEKLSFFRSLGFNRFSSGVQSFDDARLQQVGRLHSAEGAKQAVGWARKAGFDDVNIDIMCGFPDETLEEVRHTVSEALELGVDHISLYPYRPTPGTAFRILVDKDSKDLYLGRQKAGFQLGRRMIMEAGYEEYASGYFGKVSLFALYYFQLSAPLVGFGSGAMSIYDQRFLTHMKGRLREYIAQPTHYDVNMPAGADPVVISNLRAGLSCFDGILRDHWLAATGVELDEALERPAVAGLTNYFRARGLIEDARGIRLPAEKTGNILIDLTFRLLKETQVTKLGGSRASARQPAPPGEQKSMAG